jgi:hypothetical protein
MLSTVSKYVYFIGNKPDKDHESSGNPGMSEKRNKFVKLAEARVNRAIQDIRLIGNLSNKSAYEFDEEDVKKIFRALQKAAEAARQKFGSGEGSRDSEFSLND